MSKGFTHAWNSGDRVARDLLAHVHSTSPSRRESVRRASARSVHPAVLDSVQVSHEAQRVHLNLLAAGGACAVVTGQQAGLFGGPLYTVYKAAAAIANAAALTEETGTPCVPVFWLQNEDHDFEEIRHAQVPDRRGESIRFSVEATGSDSQSVSQRSFTDTVGQALDGLRQLLGEEPDWQEAFETLRDYRPGSAPDTAFVVWLEALFGRFGLLVVNPRLGAMVEAARPVHLRSIRQCAEIEQVLSNRVNELEQAGFRAQVYVRPNSPLCFAHPEGLRGSRHRVEREGSDWRVCGSQHVLTDEALLQCAYSTSALLRPILQDTLLPTAAYVGGPGEIAYFAQLPPLYDLFDLPMPMVVPRARFRVVDSGSQRLLDQLGLQVDCLDGDLDGLRRGLSVVPDGFPTPEALEAALTSPFQQELGKAGPVLQQVDPTLNSALSKTQQAVERSIQKLTRRYADALARRDSVTHERLDRLLLRLMPQGAPQERIHSWPAYGARYGVEGFVDAVVGAVRPFDGTLVNLVLP